MPDNEENSAADELLSACLEGPSSTWASAVEKACQEQPEWAAELRARFERLADLGLTSSGDGPPDRSEDFGDFRLLAPLGGGAMGIVYLAWWTERGMPVAIKLMRPGRLFHSDTRRRFKREMQLAALIEHPAICEVYEVGEHDGTPYIAMRLVEGQTLEERTESGILPDRTAITEILREVEQIALALHAAHLKGLVHRDLKPANIMVTPERETVLLDFGLARRFDSDSEALTDEAGRVGTPAYMSPEALAGGSLDPRTDIYSLGATLFECLSGTRPYHGATAQAMMHEIISAPVPDPRIQNSAVSPALALVVRTALAKRPRNRYQNAGELAADLAAARLGQRLRAQKPRILSRTWRLVQRRPKAAAYATGASFALLLLAWFGLEFRAKAISSRAQNAVIEAFAGADPLEVIRQVSAAVEALVGAGNPSPVQDVLRNRVVGFHDFVSLRRAEEMSGVVWGCELGASGERLLVGIGNRVFAQEERGSTLREKWAFESQPGFNHLTARLFPTHNGALVTWAGEGETPFNRHMLLFDGQNTDPVFERSGLLCAQDDAQGVLWVELDGAGRLRVGRRSPQGVDSVHVLEGTADANWESALASPGSGRLFAVGRMEQDRAILRAWNWSATGYAPLIAQVDVKAESPAGLTCSEDGKLAVTASKDGKRRVEPAQIWAVENDGLHLRGALQSGALKEPAAELVVSGALGEGQEHLIACVHDDRVLRVWDEHCSLRHTMADLPTPRVPRFRPGTLWFEVWCSDSTVRVFDEQGRSRATLAAGTLARGQLHAASFLPSDLPVLVTGSEGNGVREWSLLPAGQVPLAGIRGGVSSTLSLADAGYVLTTSGGEIYRIQPSSHHPPEVQIPRLKSEGIIDAASFGMGADQGAFLTQVGAPGSEFRVHILQFGDLRERAACSLPPAWGPARQIACGSREGIIWVLCGRGLFELDLSNKELSLPDTPLTTMGGWVLAAGAQSETPFAVLSDSNGVRLWWQDGESPLPHLVSAMGVSPDGRYLAMAGGTERAELGQCTIYTLSANSKEPIRQGTFTEHTGRVTCIAFSKDSRWLATSGADGLICLRSTEPGSSPAHVAKLRGHAGTVRSLAFSLDGQELLSGDDKQVALRWPLTDEALLMRVESLLEGK